MLGGKRRCAEGMTVTDPRMELLVPAWGAHRKHAFVSHSLEAGSSRSDVIPAEGPLAGFQMATFSLRPHVAETDRQTELSGVSSYKDTNPSGSGPHPYDLI